MALSNILREPLREIIETVIGLLPILPLFGVAYYIATWLHGQNPANPHPWGLCWMFGLVMAAAGILFFCGLMAAIHSLGEKICDALAGAGWEIRPRDRYR